MQDTFSQTYPILRLSFILMLSPCTPQSPPMESILNNKYHCFKLTFTVIFYVKKLLKIYFKYLITFKFNFLTSCTYLA